MHLRHFLRNHALSFPDLSPSGIEDTISLSALVTGVLRLIAVSFCDFRDRLRNNKDE